MEAGKLDRRLTLLQLVKTTNAMNEEEESWTSVGTVWASKEDVSDKEQRDAQEVGATITSRFQVRYSVLAASVRPTWRLRLKAKRTGQVEREYEVTGVKDVKDDIAGLEFTATARTE